MATPTMRRVFLLCTWLAVGCDSLHEELPGLFAVAPRGSAQTEDNAKPNQRLPERARQLETRWKAPAMPALGADRDCARARTLEVVDADAKRIVLTNVDVRTQTRSLIARRVSERLESGETALLSSVLDASPTARPTDAHRDIPLAALSLTLDDLSRMQKQRYLGVFYLTDYQGPSLILRVGKIRREWFPGHLQAKFVLFDTERQSAVCGLDLRVTNDVKTAPIRSRLQAETRNRLERALGDALRAEAQRALANLTPQLMWPESATQAP